MRAAWVAGAIVVTAGAGCALILGGDKDYHEVGAASGGSGGSGGATGSASSGGASSTSSGGASSTSSSASTGVSSGTGGAPMCQLLHDTQDCGAGHRCTIDNEVTGTTKCVPIVATAMSPYEACSSDDACPAGTWCDYRTNVCTPFCESSSDCIGNCVAAVNDMHKSIPYASVCTAHCDPVDAGSCGPDAACNYDTSLADFDCFRSAGKLDGESCSFGDCAPTLVCTSQCVYWCHPAGASSPDCGGSWCAHFANQSPMYNGKVYGYCQ